MNPVEQSDATRRGFRNTALWFAVSAAVAILLYLFVDMPVTRLIAPYHHGLPAWLKVPRNIVREYGQGYFVLAAAAAIALFDPRYRRDVIRFAVGVAIASAVAVTLKSLTGRARPDELLVGAPAWKLLVGLRDNEFISFPSAHAASAFACSAMLGTMYRKWGWVFYTLAALCAVSRVVDVQHFPSDIAVGAAIGLWSGYGAFRWKWCGRLATAIVPMRNGAPSQ